MKFSRQSTTLNCSCGLIAHNCIPEVFNARLIQSKVSISSSILFFSISIPISQIDIGEINTPCILREFSNEWMKPSERVEFPVIAHNQTWVSKSILCCLRFLSRGIPIFVYRANDVSLEVNGSPKFTKSFLFFFL